MNRKSAERNSLALGTPTRREFIAGASSAALVAALPSLGKSAEATNDFKLRYILASAMYGYTAIEEILPEVKKTGATTIDLWPKKHGNQREQVEELGHERFAELLKQEGIGLGCSTCYYIGPFNLESEMRFAEKIGGRGVTIVCAARGPKALVGSELKSAVAKFVEQMKPHAAMAEETGCTIAIENHANSLIESPDSIRWFGEMVKSEALGIALAPHHLPQEGELIAQIALDLGPKVSFFYAQQHGHGSKKKLPEAEMLTQMPGRGPLDFKPIVAALRKINFQGYTEIFMHPVPRGIPILDSTAKITAEINRSREYLEACTKS